MTGGVGAVALWGAVASALLGLWRPRLTVVAAGLAALAACALAWALVTLDFSLAYVAETTNRATAAPLRLAGLSGGNAGSLLLFGTVVLAAGLGLLRTPDQRRVLAAAAAGLLGTGAVLANPFTALAAPANDGGGLVPILRHPAMLYHPPLLYLGAALTVVPFALTLAPAPAPARARGHALDAAWLVATRRAALASWTVLTVAMAAGAHWSYGEVGWGGFWAWDPVENGILLPWLALTAFIHASRTGVRRSTVALAAAAFPLVLLGQALTRSGQALSVHGFAQNTAVGAALLAAALAAATAAALATRRAPRATAKLPRLFALNHALLAYAAAVVFVGTAAPLVTNDAVAVDPRFFNLYCAPAAAAAAIAAVAARRNLAHIGIVVLLAGAVASSLGSSKAVWVPAGETAHGVTNLGWSATADPDADRMKLTADIAVDGRRLSPRIDTYAGAAQGTAEVAVWSRPHLDVVVSLRHIDRATGDVIVDVHRKPFVQLVWWGAGLVALGGVVPLVRGRGGGRRRRPAPLAVEQPGQALVDGLAATAATAAATATAATAPASATTTTPA